MINVLIPMGGKGQRFRNAGYQLTKPLIEVNGIPMIKKVIDNLDLQGKHIFLVNQEDYYQFELSTILRNFCGEKECEIILENPSQRQGAAAACLLATQMINNEDQLIVANSDQLVEWSSNQFLQHMKEKDADGGILTFTASDPKWSFAKSTEEGLVNEVAEKNPISNKATAGIYWFKYGKDFVNGVRQMMTKNIRVNGEFYVCPVFNELIQQGKKIYDYHINVMHGLGTPEDLERYLKL